MEEEMVQLVRQLLTHMKDKVLSVEVALLSLDILYKRIQLCLLEFIII